VLLAAVSLAAAGIAGFSVATTAEGDRVYFEEMTVQQVVTVERAGRLVTTLVTTRVPVVRTRRERAVTQFVDRIDTLLSTVTTPGGVWWFARRRFNGGFRSWYARSSPPTVEP
jgi:hypothetical protein